MFEASLSGAQGLRSAVVLTVVALSLLASIGSIITPLMGSDATRRGSHGLATRRARRDVRVDGGARPANRIDGDAKPTIRLPTDRIDADAKPTIRSARLAGISLAFATCVLTVPSALGVAVALARYLPLSESARFSIAFALAFPLWGSALLLTALSRDAVRAWALCGVTALLVWGLAYWP